MAELRECPFCGKHESKIVPANERFRMYCYSCHNFTKTFTTELEAEQFWNTRSEPEASALTAEELREMHGKPVWVEELEEWAIVNVDTVGQYKNMPFVQGSNFNFDVVVRKLTCYDREPKGE